MRTLPLSRFVPVLLLVAAPGCAHERAPIAAAPLPRPAGSAVVVAPAAAPTKPEAAAYSFQLGPDPHTSDFFREVIVSRGGTVLQTLDLGSDDDRDLGADEVATKEFALFDFDGDGKEDLVMLFGSIAAHAGEGSSDPDAGSPPTVPPPFQGNYRNLLVWSFSEDTHRFDPS